MSQSKVHGVFPNHASAGGALSALAESGFEPGKIAVIGADCDAFREATATLQSRKGDKFVLWAGSIGALLGCVAGLVCAPDLPRADVSNFIMVPFWAAFSGAAVGLSAGFTIGGLLRIDDIPRSDAEIRLGQVNGGDLAISVQVEPSDLESVQSLFIEHGATHISLDISAEVPEAILQPVPQVEAQTVSQPIPLFSKTA